MPDAAPRLPWPVVGILGGMGPEATVDLMRRVIAATPAEDDIDHIHMLVDSNPKVPSRIAALIDETGESPLPELIRMARGLEANGATVLAIACNTAHAYAPAIAAAVDIELLDMVALTVARVASMPLVHRRVGLLASTAVLKVGLYERALAAENIATRPPARQDDLMAIIRAVKRGDTGAEQRAKFVGIARELAGDVDLLLIACTELSLLADSLDRDPPVIDAMDVLVEKIVAVGR